MVRNLRKLRTNKGVSQQQLADVIGISQQSVNKYENHNVEPDLSTLMKIADYFEASVDYLIGHNTDPNENPSDCDTELSREEWKVIHAYRLLTKEERDSIRLILKNYTKHK